VIGTSEIIEDVHEAWEIGITMVHLLWSGAQG